VSIPDGKMCALRICSVLLRGTLNKRAVLRSARVKEQSGHVPAQAPSFLPPSNGGPIDARSNCCSALTEPDCTAPASLGRCQQPETHRLIWVDYALLRMAAYERRCSPSSSETSCAGPQKRTAPVEVTEAAGDPHARASRERLSCV
jgi:hypothetical protein